MDVSYIDVTFFSENANYANSRYVFIRRIREISLIRGIRVENNTGPLQKNKGAFKREHP